MQKPTPIIQPGDTIGIIAPSGSFLKSRLDTALKYFENAGYHVKLGKYIYKSDRYLAGSAQERAKDIQDMFHSKTVKAIFAARGGFGATQVLPFLDYSLIQKNAKPLFGFSDTTALQLALWQKSKLPSISGLALCADITKNRFSAYTRKYLEDFIKTSQFESIPLIGKKPKLPIDGILIGGCISLVAALCGSEFQPQFKNRILFLEDIKEEPYCIDRMLTQLAQQKDFKYLKAIIFGEFFECTSEKPNYGTIETVLQKFTKSHSIPVFTNLPYGHQPDRRQIPIGLHVTIDENALLNFAPFPSKK